MKVSHFWNHGDYQKTLENIIHTNLNVPVLINKQIGGGFSNLNILRRLYLHPVSSQNPNPNSHHPSIEITEVKVPKVSRELIINSKPTDCFGHSKQDGAGLCPQNKEIKFIPVPVPSKVVKQKSLKKKKSKTKKSKKSKIEKERSRKDIFS